MKGQLFSRSRRPGEYGWLDINLAQVQWIRRDEHDRAIFRFADGTELVSGANIEVVEAELNASAS